MAILFVMSGVQVRKLHLKWNKHLIYACSYHLRKYIILYTHYIMEILLKLTKTKFDVWKNGAQFEIGISILFCSCYNWVMNILLKTEEQYV